MAIRRKTRGKRKKVPITKAARKTRKKIKKRAKKLSPRPAPPKKARPTATTASKPKSGENEPRKRLGRRRAAPHNLLHPNGVSAS
jgi:hypothetical protein